MGLMTYSSDQFAPARLFLFGKWCDWASQRGAAVPGDLSGACKYGSLFVCRLFGGSIQGNYQHQFNDIEGIRVDLGRDAEDVAQLARPYQHDPEYFAIPEVQAALHACLPRVDAWVTQYLAELRAMKRVRTPTAERRVPP